MVLASLLTLAGWVIVGYIDTSLIDEDFEVFAILDLSKLQLLALFFEALIDHLN